MPYTPQLISLSTQGVGLFEFLIRHWFRPSLLSPNSSSVFQALNVIIHPFVKDASVPSPTASWWESTIPHGTRSVCSAPCVNSLSPPAVTSEKGNFTANTTTNSKHNSISGRESPAFSSFFFSFFFCCISSHCWLVCNDLKKKKTLWWLWLLAWRPLCVCMCHVHNAQKYSHSVDVKSYLNFTRFNQWKKKINQNRDMTFKLTCCHCLFSRRLTLSSLQIYTNQWKSNRNQWG